MKSEKAMTKEEVQGLLQFRKRGHKIPTTKGKGSVYNRQKEKNKNYLTYDK